MIDEETRDCPWCDGAGHTGFTLCETCEGWGWGWLERDGSFTPDLERDPAMTKERLKALWVDARAERDRDEAADLEAVRSDN